MKVYFAGSIRGGRQLLRTYRHIIRFLRAEGHTVLTEHVASPGIENDSRELRFPVSTTPVVDESGVPDREIFVQDIRMLEEADCLIAEVTVPSTGVGYEICHAIHRGKPVLCVHEDGARVSAMVMGNTDGNCTVRSYRTAGELEGHIEVFLSSTYK